jgi:hypothetical protein
MKADQNKAGGGFWLAWVLVSIIGFSVAAMLGAKVAYVLFDRDDFDATLAIATGIVMGAIIGYLQWVVLREKITRADWWVLASALGFAAFLATPGVVGLRENPSVVGILGVIALGLVGGSLQCLILRQQIKRVGWWMVGTMSGALVGEVGFPILTALGATSNYDLSAIILGLTFGTGYGAITGGVLVALLSQADSSRVEEMATTH